jgi:hypothetical protein
VDFTGLCTSQFKDSNIANFVKSGMLAMKSVRQKDFEAGHHVIIYSSMRIKIKIDNIPMFPFTKQPIAINYRLITQ